MNILYTLNNAFVPQVAASITSVCENNQTMSDIDFYLMHTDITKTNQIKLQKYLQKYHRNLHFIKLDNIKKYFDFDFDTKGWNPVILARLLLGQLLPNNVHKILYLDGDTIVRGSLQELWDTDLSKHAIAASIEPTVDQKRKTKLGLRNYPYYNTGVLLINLDIWRQKQVGEQIIKYYQKNDGNLFAPDQDAINGCEKAKILTLSPKYNSFNIFYQYPYRFLVKLCDFKYVSQEEYQEAKDNPVIVHYLGEERPWRIGNPHKYRHDYLKYLSLTPWKNQNLEQGWKFYFICWRIFNTITKPFPALRYNIINKLIPVFMKHRSNQLVKNHEK